MKKTRFKRIYIEIGNICNKSCAFCPKTIRPLEQMSLERFNIVLDKIQGQTNHIYLHVLGEPLIHKELPKILDSSFNYGLNVNITTNGTNLADNYELMRHKAIRKISISVHSFEANTITTSLKKYLDTIVDFAKSLGKEKIIELRLWNLTDKNYSKLNEDIIKYMCDSFGFTDTIDIAKALNYKLVDQVYLVFASHFEWPNEAGPCYGDEGYCLALKDQVAILVNGDVVPCCLDNNGVIKLGNIFESDFESIINSTRAKNMIEGFRQRKRVENLCKHCEYSTRFDI